MEVWCRVCGLLRSLTIIQWFSPFPFQDPQTSRTLTLISKTIQTLGSLSKSKSVRILHSFPPPFSGFLGIPTHLLNVCSIDYDDGAEPFSVRAQHPCGDASSKGNDTNLCPLLSTHVWALRQALLGNANSTSCIPIIQPSLFSWLSHEYEL